MLTPEPLSPARSFGSSQALSHHNLPNLSVVIMWGFATTATLVVAASSTASSFVLPVSTPGTVASRAASQVKKGNHVL